MSLDEELCADRRIKGLARKLVRRINGEGPLPPEIEVLATSEEWAVIPDVGRILGVAAYQKGRKAVFRIPIERRNPSEWGDIRAVFATKVTGDDPIRQSCDSCDATKGQFAISSGCSNGPLGASRMIRQYRLLHFRSWGPTSSAIANLYERGHGARCSSGFFVLLSGWTRMKVGERYLLGSVLRRIHLQAS